MKSGKTTRDLILGLVFFGALALLLMATFRLGTMAEQMKPPRVLLATFTDSQGLKSGDPVLVLGMRSGRVDSTELGSRRKGDATQNVVLVRFLLTANHELQLREDTSVRIIDNSLLGGKVIYIEPGTGKPRTQPDTTPLTGDERQSFIAGLSEALGVRESIDNIREIVQGVRDIVAAVRDGKGPIGALINERKLHDDLTGLIADLRAGKGTVGKALTDPSLFDSLKEFFDNARDVARRLSTAMADPRSGPLGVIVSSPEAADHVSGTLANIHSATDRLTRTDNLIGRLLNEQKLADTVSAALDDLKSLLDDAAHGRGLLGVVLRDKAVADQFAGVIADLKEVTGKVARGEGSLGRLIMDDRLILRLERLLNQFSRTLEDAREAAPIGTFFQVFGGAFY